MDPETSTDETMKEIISGETQPTSKRPETEASESFCVVVFLQSSHRCPILETICDRFMTFNKNNIP